VPWNDQWRFAEPMASKFRGDRGPGKRGGSSQQRGGYFHTPFVWAAVALPLGGFPPPPLTVPRRSWGSSVSRPFDPVDTCSNLESKLSKLKASGFRSRSAVGLKELASLGIVAKYHVRGRDESDHVSASRSEAGRACRGPLIAVDRFEAAVPLSANAGCLSRSSEGPFRIRPVDAGKPAYRLLSGRPTFRPLRTCTCAPGHECARSSWW
jgi:hypothetical protein